MAGIQKNSGQGAQANPSYPPPGYQKKTDDNKTNRRHVDQFSQHLEQDPESTINTTPSSATATERGKARPVPDSVFMVNNLVNQNYQYAHDSEQFNAKDYWQTPTEMKEHMSGDCEDFALLKHHILVQRGVSEENLSFAYGRLGEQSHLVTLYKDGDGFEHILDNATSDIRTVEERDDFRLLVRFKMSDVAYGEDGWAKVLAKLRAESGNTENR